jgi:3-hydroxymyristoyl/3-hydroxydecanoyl-(acyl carrier protein) dehydratase
MSGRFRSFSFVDRITRLDRDGTGARVEGHFGVPLGVHFPASLMAEAVGQLAAWSAMAQLDFACRPVAGLAGAVLYHQLPQPGCTLQLQADIERCDAEAVAYSGKAFVDGRLALELQDSVGPMLPMDEFDAPESVRADFHTLRGAGAAPGRFGGVPEPGLHELQAQPGERLCALLRVPELAEAPYFDDHFPRRPVFPGTLLMDALATLSLQLAQQSPSLAAAGPLVTRKVSQVKIRSFTAPGAQLQLEAVLQDIDAQRARLKVTARSDDKTVATARIEVAPGSAP